MLLPLTLAVLVACATTPRVLPPPTPVPPDPATAPLAAEIPVDPTVRVGRLDNGLTYYVRANHRPEKRAELRLLVNSGSLQEDDDQQGLAHFVEHMAFNGTRHFAKQDLVDYLESIGMRFAADLNASTSFDETLYMLQRVPTDDPEILEKAFLILEDWAGGITFEGEEIDAERGVLVEEWRIGRGATARIRDQQFPILFRGSRYAERLPIGRLEILEKGSHEALRRFYRDWYRPDLMAIVAVGDFDPQAIEDRIRDRFATLPETPEPRARETWPVPDHAQTLFGSTADPEATTTVVAVYYKLPREGEGTYGDYRRSLVEVLFNDMFNARLDEIGQRPEPPFLYAFSGKQSLVRSRSVFSQAAAVRDGEVRRGLEAVLTEARRVDRHGFTISELERTKIDLLRRYEQAWRERDKVLSASLASEYGRNFLEGESIPGLATELALVRRFLPTIELAEVNRLAAQWISEENRVILVSGPEKEGLALPAEDELLAVFAAVEQRPVEPWVDQVLDEPLLAELPEPGVVVAETMISELEVTDWRLANGVRVLLKPTDFRNDQILLHGFSPGGDSLATDEEHTSAIFATTILAEGGLGNFSRIELDKALAGTVASISPYVGELEEGVRGQASPQDLETMLQLLYLTFTAPRFDEDACQSLTTRLRTVVENRLSRPETVFRDRLGEVLSQGHRRRRPPSPELLAEIDPQLAVAFYRDRFADAGDFTFILVGNFEPAGIRPLVERYLGGLPAAGREESWRDVGVRPPEEVVRFEVRKGIEPKSQVQVVFTGPATWSREGVHDALSLAAVLTIRLREVLREELGATYGVGVGGSLYRRPRQVYRMAISFGCAPGEAESMVATLLAELEAIKENGIDESYLAKVRESQRRQREIDLRENSFWLEALHTYLNNDLDPRLILAYDELVAALTGERIREAARRYLDAERYVLGILYPQADPR